MVLLDLLYFQTRSCRHWCCVSDGCRARHLCGLHEDAGLWRYCEIITENDTGCLKQHDETLFFHLCISVFTGNVWSAANVLLRVRI